jgi:hypothetical protein
MSATQSARIHNGAGFPTCTGNFECIRAGLQGAWAYSVRSPGGFARGSPENQERCWLEPEVARRRRPPVCVVEVSNMAEYASSTKIGKLRQANS